MSQKFNDSQSNTALAGAPQIKQIEILELLGKGGMSVVYKARQKELDRVVAVKVISHLDEHEISRFQAEAKLSATLDHPNLIHTLGFGVSENAKPYLVMEYLEGRSLADELSKNPIMQLRRFKEIFLPVLAGLEYAHQKGLVHRDLKPSNIMLCITEDGTETPKIVDFGIAKYAGDDASWQQRLTQTGALVGSPRYMSPEQCNGDKVDRRSDIYSISCVMYEALCGKAPFESDSALELMHNHLKARPPGERTFVKASGIPKQLARIIVEGLDKDPQKRPGSAAELSKALSTFLTEKLLENNRRHKTVSTKTVLLVSVLAFVLLSPLAYQIYQQGESSNQARNVTKDLEMQIEKAESKDNDFERTLLLRTELVERLARSKPNSTEYAIALLHATDNGLILLKSQNSKYHGSKFRQNLLEQSRKILKILNKHDDRYLECKEFEIELLALNNKPQEAAQAASQSIVLFKRRAESLKYLTERVAKLVDYLLADNRFTEAYELAKWNTENAKANDEYKTKAGLLARIGLGECQLGLKQKTEALETSHDVTQDLEQSNLDKIEKGQVEKNLRQLNLKIEASH